MNILSRITATFRGNGRITAAPARISPATTGRPILDRITLPTTSTTPWQFNLNQNPTPIQIKQVLELGLGGDLAGQWQLFTVMQDTWPRLRKDLHELRSAVARSPWKIVPASVEGAPPTPEAERRAALARASLLNWSPTPGSDENGFEDCIYDLTDALACGISVQEILWEQKGAALRPRASVWVNPRYYGLMPAGRIGLRVERQNLYAPARPGDSQALPPDKFLVATHRSATGGLGAQALLRPLAWWWGAALWGRDWMLNYAQLYGQPIRWVTHDPSCDPATLSVLDQMMEQLGSSGWGRFPAGTSLDLKESAKSSGENPQERIMALADKACDLLILGETLTSDVGASGSRALGDVHESVLDERKTTLAKWAADVINYQLLPAFTRLNFGTDDECPILTINDTSKPDLDKLATRLEIVSRLGLAIPSAWAHKQFEIPEPKDGEPVLESKAAAAPAFGPGAFGKGGEAPTDQPEPKARQDQTAGDRTHFSASSPAATRPRDVPAQIAAQKSAALAQVFRGAMAPIRRIVEESTSAADLEAKLRTYYADWPAARIASVMEDALQIRAAAGAADAVHAP